MLQTGALRITECQVVDLDPQNISNPPF